jgi:hypothetical protein
MNLQMTTFKPELLFIFFPFLSFLPQLKQNGEACNVSEHNIKMSLLMYFSYFVLFARFFYKAYVDRRAPRKGLVDTRGSSATASIDHSSSNGTAMKVQ